MSSLPPSLYPRGTRVETASKGFDPRFQTFGTGPYNQSAYIGIPVPLFVPATGDRFLFVLANTRVGIGEKNRIVGLRQLATILAPILGEDGLYNAERTIVSSPWSFQDGNISWHLHQVPPLPNMPADPSNREGAQANYAQTPALVFQSTDFVTNYVPPALQGSPIVPELGEWHDLRFPWFSSNAWTSLDIEVEGPCDVVLYASVRQTDPQTRAALAIADLNAGQIAALGGGGGEDLFVAAFPTSMYGRVAGSIIMERPSMQAPPRPIGSEFVTMRKEAK